MANKTVNKKLTAEQMEANFLDNLFGETVTLPPLEYGKHRIRILDIDWRQSPKGSPFLYLSVRVLDEVERDTAITCFYKLDQETKEFSKQGSGLAFFLSAIEREYFTGKKMVNKEVMTRKFLIGLELDATWEYDTTWGAQWSFIDRTPQTNTATATATATAKYDDDDDDDDDKAF